jgi:WD40 repeat protein
MHVSKIRSVTYAVFILLAFFVAGSQVQLFSYDKGDKVKCNWKQRGKYYKGTVAKRIGDKLWINYDDGDKEVTRIRFCDIIPNKNVIVIDEFDSVDPNATYKKGETVLMKVNGKQTLAWVVRPDGPKHSIISMTWDAKGMKRVTNTELRKSKYTQFKKEERTITGYTINKPTLLRVVSSPKSEYAVGLTNEGELIRFEKETMYAPLTIDTGGLMQSAAMSLDGKYVALCDYNRKELRMYQMPNLKLVQKLNYSQDCKYLTFSPKGVLAFQDVELGLYIFDYVNSKISKAQLFLDYNKLSRTSLTFGAKGDYLYAGLEEKKQRKNKNGVVVYKVNGLNIQKVTTIKTRDPVYRVAVSKDNSYLAIALRDEIKLASIATRKILWTKAPKGQYHRLKFSPYDNSFLTCAYSLSGDLNLWNISGNKTTLNSEFYSCENMVFTSPEKVIGSRHTSTNFGETGFKWIELK